MLFRQHVSQRAIDSFTQIATLRIDLNHSDLPIWRVVEVPTSITLKVLHDVVQIAMGWLDYHLWEMAIGGQTYRPGRLIPSQSLARGVRTIRAYQTRAGPRARQDTHPT